MLAYLLGCSIPNLFCVLLGTHDTGLNKLEMPGTNVHAYEGWVLYINSHLDFV